MSATELTDRVFRRSAGRLVAHLTRSLGAEYLDLVEDSVQDALVSALQTWPFNGIPENPEGWLYRAARNRALDALRRSSGSSRNLAAAALEPSVPPVDVPETFADDQLTMMFLCCHPALTSPMRVGLTLKVVAGLGIDEVAAAFLVQRSTIEQRLVRAKRLLRSEGASFCMPSDDVLEGRLHDVLAVLYLTFNEGYSASSGDLPIRGELCTEAIRLGNALADNRITDRPEVHALLALMYFQASRLPARIDPLGGVIVLEDQDRSRWDHHAIEEGFRHLDRAAAGTILTAYHLEAGIASYHAAAPSVAATDWPHILELYDHLLAVDPSPVVRLNRAVAVAMVRGPLAGIAEIEDLDHDPCLRRYHLLPAVRAYLLERAGRTADAARDYARAAELAGTGAERDLMERRRTFLLRGHGRGGTTPA